MEEVWSFDNDELFDLVKSGRKTATCCLYHSDRQLSHAGDESILENSKHEQLRLKTLAVSVRRFCDIDAEWAGKEGEGDLTLEYWQKVHRDFFIKRCAAHNTSFNDEILLECEEFKVIKK
jgi:uncharacterized protein YhfF